MSETSRKRIAVAGGVVLFFALSFLIAPYLQGGIDWYETFYPAGRAALAGKSPYTVAGFCNVPWAILPILPFTLLPIEVGRAAFMLFSLLAFAYIARKLGASPLVTGIFVMSPPVLHCLLNANIDWLTLLGFILPPQIGLFFIAIKPQTTFVVGIFWFFEAWRKGGVKEVLRVFLPVTVTLLLSFALFGFWIERFRAPVNFGWNASLYPMSIPIGLALLVKSLRARSKSLAMAASPFLSPYVAFHSWSGALLAFAAEPLEMSAAVLGLWILIAIRFVALYA